MGDETVTSLSLNGTGPQRFDPKKGFDKISKGSSGQSELFDVSSDE